MSEQDVRAVHAAGEAAAMGRREHYHQNILGQGANAGDPQPAEPTQQSNPTAGQNPQATVSTKSTL
jgi:hypothetical protein